MCLIYFLNYNFTNLSIYASFLAYRPVPPWKKLSPKHENMLGAIFGWQILCWYDKNLVFRFKTGIFRYHLVYWKRKKYCGLNISLCSVCLNTIFIYMSKVYQNSGPDVLDAALFWHPCQAISPKVIIRFSKCFLCWVSFDERYGSILKRNQLYQL